MLMCDCNARASIIDSPLYILIKNNSGLCNQAAVLKTKQKQKRKNKKIIKSCNKKRKKVGRSTQIESDKFVGCPHLTDDRPTSFKNQNLAIKFKEVNQILKHVINHSSVLKQSHLQHF